MKAVRIAISVFLLVGLSIGAVRADALQKYGDCSHLKVDQRNSPPAACVDKTDPQCAWEKALDISGTIKRSDRQALFRAKLAALAWQLGKKEDAAKLFLVRSPKSSIYPTSLRRR